MLKNIPQNEALLRMASLTWDSHMPHAMPLILSVVWIMERSPFGAGRRRRSAGRNHEK